MKSAGPLNILWLAGWYPSAGKPALGNFIMRHAEAAALFNRIIVVHAVASGSDQIEVSESKGVLSIVVYYRNASLPVKFMRWKKAWNRGIATAVDEFGTLPHLVHLNVIVPAGLIAADYCQSHRLPLVVTEHSTRYHDKLNFFEKWITRRTLNSATLLAPVTAQLGQAVIRYSDKKCTMKVVPNVVDTGLFKPTAVKRSDCKHILHVSTLNERQKNITGILRVVKRLSDIRQDFVFEAISECDYSHAQQYAAQIGIDKRFVRFHSFQPIAEVARAMQQADVFVLFSNYENLPCVLLESVSCGLPVISTDVGGIREQINASCGVLIKKGDEDELLFRLIEMLDHPQRYHPEQMHRHIETTCSYQSVGRQMDEIYRSVTGRV